MIQSVVDDERVTAVVVVVDSRRKSYNNHAL